MWFGSDTEVFGLNRIFIILPSKFQSLAKGGGHG
jgi:hypothetical protein